jgi:hypothetical protein
MAQGIPEKVYRDTSLASHQTLDMVLNTDGTMVFCGAALTNDSIGLHRSFLMKLNADYSIAWYKAYQRSDPYQYYYINNIISLNDGGYLVTFLKDQTGANVGIMKIDSAGNIQYERKLVDTVQQSTIELNCIFQISDSTYLLSLKVNTLGIQGTVVLKIDLLGNVLENIRIQGATPCLTNSIIRLLDGNYLLTVYERDGPFDLFSLYFLDENLDTLWKKSYHEGPYWASYRASYPMQLTDSSIWIFASKNSSQSSPTFEPVISKFTSTGDMIWGKKYIDTTQVNNGFRMGKEINGKIYGLIPYNFQTPSAVYIVAFDTSGQTLSQQAYSYGPSLHSSYFTLKNDSLLLPFASYTSPRDFGFILVDTTLTHSCSSDFINFTVDTISPFPYVYNAALSNSTISTKDTLENYIMFTQTFSEIPFCPTANISDEDRTYFTVYPNPASDYIKISFEENILKAKLLLHDIFGRRMETIFISDKSEFSIDVNNLVNEIYFITIESDNFRQTVPFVKL